MEEFQSVVQYQVVLPSIPVIVDVQGMEVKEELARMMDHGVAVPQPVNHVRM